MAHSEREPEQRASFTLSGLHVIVMFGVLVAGAGAGWGTITAQLTSNRDTLDRLEKRVENYQEQLAKIREHQIINEGIIDQSAADIEQLKQLQGIDGNLKHRRATDGPK